MKTLSFVGSDKKIQPGQIFCLGRNFAAHAREMHGDVPAEPIVFLKPTTALVCSGEQVILPKMSREVHHEVELVVVIGKETRDVARERAFDSVEGYAIGLDMTMRDVQRDAQKKGLPWAVAKGFDTSAPISDIVGREMIANPHDLTISLSVNGVIRQQANTGSMIFRVDQVVAYLSQIFTLRRGDLIFMGTPEGVGPVASGDLLEARLGSVATLRVTVA